jgi:membrane-bound ClpP family serine protease
MTSERVYYSDANGISIGTEKAVFGEHSYTTKRIESVSIVRQTRWQTPGIMMMMLGVVLLPIGWFLGNSGVLLVGAVGFLSGTFYFRRKRPTFGVRIVTDRGSTFVLATFQKFYAEQVREAVLRAMEETRADSAG